MPGCLTHLGGLKVRGEALLAAILQAAEQPMFVVDAKGLIRFANRAAVAALGHERAEELVGRHRLETVAPPGTVSSELDWYLRRDGSRFPVSSVSVPLDMADGRGAVVAFTGIEARLRAEEELRERETALAREQASLRRVAALAAGGASSAEVFAAVAHEVATVMRLPMVMVGRYDDDGATVTIIGAWSDRPHPFEPGTRWPVDEGGIAAGVPRTRRPAKVDDSAKLGKLTGVPIVVDGRAWGVMSAASPDAPLPEHVEDRLADFTALVATAISSSQAREDVHRLADEQAALRRVATLVAEGATRAEVFASVAREAGLVLALPLIAMYRYEADGTATVVGSSGEHPFQPGTNWPLDGPTLASMVRQTGRPARVEDYADVPGGLGEAALRAGFTSGVGAPIVVDSELWGVVAACSDDRQPLPSEAESRLGEFTALVATAISNSQAREELRVLADEQAALRRVATLVAEGATPAEVFAAVASTVGQVLKLPLIGMYRYEADGMVTVVGASGDHPFRPGTRWALDGPTLASVVRQTGRTARLDDYRGIPGTLAETARGAGIRAGVAAPIVVDSEVWGVVCACSDQPAPLARDAERRLSQFTALVATATSNSQAREDLSMLVHEQAALRRLATLVAQGAEPRVVFDAVCEETVGVLGAGAVSLDHFTSDGSDLTVAGGSARGVHVPPGTRLPLDGDSVRRLVRDTAAPARMDSYEGASGELAELIRRRGIRSEVGAPVAVGGRVWGALIAASDGPDALPAGTELRLASFAELIATAVSNGAARSELVASRVRIVEAADEQRRRVARDLHDGAQSRLILAVIALERARIHDDVPPDLMPLLEEGLMHARSAIGELRELAHGIHPAILTNDGLAAAVEVLADRAPLPVELGIPEERFPTAVESAAYFVAAEALTNVVKYARASKARIAGARTAAGLCLVIEDDGVGGAKRAPGAGLAGLGDRLAALDGVLVIDSPPGGGTRIRAEIPLPPAT